MAASAAAAAAAARLFSWLQRGESDARVAEALSAPALWERLAGEGEGEEEEEGTAGGGGGEHKAGELGDGGVLLHEVARCGGKRTLQRLLGLVSEAVAAEQGEEAQVDAAEAAERRAALGTLLHCLLRNPACCVPSLRRAEAVGGDPSNPDDNTVWLACDDAGRMPLAVALAYCRAPALHGILRFVMERIVRAGGATVLSAKDTQGDNALHALARRNPLDTEIVRTLAAATVISGESQADAVADALAEAMSKTNCKGSGRETPLHAAMTNPSLGLSALQALLGLAGERHKASDALCVRNLAGELPIHVFCRRNPAPSSDCLQLMHDAQPELTTTQVGASKDTLLHCIVGNSRTTTDVLASALALLDDPEACCLKKNKAGELPLHTLCRVWSANDALPDAIVLLVNAGPSAVAEKHSKSGDTPLHVLVSHATDSPAFHRSVGALLPQAEDQAKNAAATENFAGDMPLHSLLRKVDATDTETSSELAVEPVQQLLQAHEHALNHHGHDGDLPAHCAARSSCVARAALELLLTRDRSSAACANQNSDLPLHVLCRDRGANLDGDLIRSVLAANPEAATVAGRGGDTVLHCAMANPATTPEVTAVLLQEVDMEHRMQANKEGHTPMRVLTQRIAKNEGTDNTEYANNRDYAVLRVMAEALPHALVTTASSYWEGSHTPFHDLQDSPALAALDIPALLRSAMEYDAEAFAAAHTEGVEEACVDQDSCTQRLLTHALSCAPASFCTCLLLESMLHRPPSGMSNGDALRLVEQARLSADLAAVVKRAQAGDTVVHLALTRLKEINEDGEGSSPAEWTDFAASLIAHLPLLLCEPRNDNYPESMPLKEQSETLAPVLNLDGARMRQFVANVLARESGTRRSRLVADILHLAPATFCLALINGLVTSGTEVLRTAELQHGMYNGEGLWGWPGDTCMHLAAARYQNATQTEGDVCTWQLVVGTLVQRTPVLLTTPLPNQALCTSPLVKFQQVLYLVFECLAEGSIRTFVTRLCEQFSPAAAEQLLLHLLLCAPPAFFSVVFTALENYSPWHLALWIENTRLSEACTGANGVYADRGSNALHIVVARLNVSADMRDADRTAASQALRLIVAHAPHLLLQPRDEQHPTDMPLSMLHDRSVLCHGLERKDRPFALRAAQAATMSETSLSELIRSMLMLGPVKLCAALLHVCLPGTAAAAATTTSDQDAVEESKASNRGRLPLATDDAQALLSSVQDVVPAQAHAGEGGDSLVQLLIRRYLHCREACTASADGEESKSGISKVSDEAKEWEDLVHSVVPNCPASLLVSENSLTPENDAPLVLVAGCAIAPNVIDRATTGLDSPESRARQLLLALAVHRPTECIMRILDAEASVQELVFAPETTLPITGTLPSGCGLPGDNILHIAARRYVHACSLHNDDDAQDWERFIVQSIAIERDSVFKSLIRQVNELQRRSSPLTLLANTPALRELEKLGVAPQEPYTALRLHICGDGEAGKSSLVAHLTEDAALRKKLADAADAGRESTEYRQARTMGAEERFFLLPRSDGVFRSWSFGQEPVRIYDQGGQKRFHIMHSSLLAGQQCAFVIVIPTAFPPRFMQFFDEEEWQQRAKEVLRRWILLLNSRVNPQSKILVACNLWFSDDMDKDAHKRIHDNCTHFLQALVASIRQKQCEGLPQLEEDVLSLCLDPSNKHAGGVRLRIHQLCSELRADLRMPQLCKRVLDAVKELKDQERRVMVTLGELTQSAQRKDPELSLHDVASLVQHLQSCGEVLCLTLTSTNISSKEKVIVQPHIFCCTILGKLFEHQLCWTDQASRSQADGASPSAVLSTRALNGQVRMEGGRLAQKTLFDDDALALPQLVSDLGWCAAVQGTATTVGERPGDGIQQTPSTEPDQEQMWLCFYLLDVWTIDTQAVVDALACQSRSVWCRIGWRLGYTDGEHTILPATFMSIQKALYEWQHQFRGEDRYNVELWQDAILLHRKREPQSAELQETVEIERTTLLLRHVVAPLRRSGGAAVEQVVDHALDVYVMGTLHTPADWAAWDDKNNDSAAVHRLMSLMEKILEIAHRAFADSPAPEQVPLQMSFSQNDLVAQTGRPHVADDMSRVDCQRGTYRVDESGNAVNPKFKLEEDRKRRHETVTEESLRAAHEQLAQVLQEYAQLRREKEALQAELLDAAESSTSAGAGAVGVARAGVHGALLHGQDEIQAKLRDQEERMHRVGEQITGLDRAVRDGFELVRKHISLEMRHALQAQTHLLEKWQASFGSMVRQAAADGARDGVASLAHALLSGDNVCPRFPVILHKSEPPSGWSAATTCRAAVEWLTLQQRSAPELLPQTYLAFVCPVCGELGSDGYKLPNPNENAGQLAGLLSRSAQALLCIGCVAGAIAATFFTVGAAAPSIVAAGKVAIEYWPSSLSEGVEESAAELFGFFDNVAESCGVGPLIEDLEPPAALKDVPADASEACEAGVVPEGAAEAAAATGDDVDGIAEDVSADGAHDAADRSEPSNAKVLAKLRKMNRRVRQQQIEDEREEKEDEVLEACSAVKQAAGAAEDQARAMAEEAEQGRQLSNISRGAAHSAPRSSNRPVLPVITPEQQQDLYRLLETLEVDASGKATLAYQRLDGSGLVRRVSGISVEWVHPGDCEQRFERHGATALLHASAAGRR